MQRAVQEIESLRSQQQVQYQSQAASTQTSATQFSAVQTQTDSQSSSSRATSHSSSNLPAPPSVAHDVSATKPSPSRKPQAVSKVTPDTKPRSKSVENHTTAVASPVVPSTAPIDASISQLERELDEFASIASRSSRSKRPITAQLPDLPKSPVQQRTRPGTSHLLAVPVKLTIASHDELTTPVRRSNSASLIRSLNQSLDDDYRDLLKQMSSVERLVTARKPQMTPLESKEAENFEHDHRNGRLGCAVCR